MGIDLVFKIVIVGDIGVGKSCLLLRYTNNYFERLHYCTIGMDYAVRKLKVDGREVKLELWDTSGQENFRSVCPSYYRNTAGALLVYDISKRETFRNILKWHSDVGCHANAHVVIMVIGNKIDLHRGREVTTEEAQNFCEENGFFFMETSAKADLNVEEAFQKISIEIYNLIIGGTYQFTNQEHGVKMVLSGPDAVCLPPRPGIPEKRRCCKWF